MQCIISVLGTWSFSFLFALEMTFSIVKQKEKLKFSTFSVTNASTISFSCLDFYLVVKKKLLLIVQIHCWFLLWWKCVPSFCICMVWLQFGSMTVAGNINSSRKEHAQCICVLLIFEEKDFKKFRQNSLEKLDMFNMLLLFSLNKTKRRLIPLAIVGLWHEGNIKSQSKLFSSVETA